MSTGSVNPAKFFSAAEQEEILRTIQAAERETSGEIRLQLLHSSKFDPIEQAKREFYRLGMDKTAQRNGVLLLLILKEHRFAILGDAGIHAVIPDGTWDRLRDDAIGRFKQGDFVGGLCQVIVQVGQILKTHFPYNAATDKNELSDEIIFGESSPN